MNEIELSVIIPSKTEKFLDNTILDVLKNSRANIEVIAVLDGYDIPRINDSRVSYIVLGKTNQPQKRQGVNLAVKAAKGKYIMTLDAHCMVAEGFDKVLIENSQPNWVQVPRRNRLDANNWCLQSLEKIPIDYEYWMWQPFLIKGSGLHSHRWEDRSRDRKDILIDDILTFQASCWFMEKEWFNKMGFMNADNYTGWGQEGEELSLTTWKNGGRVVVNKKTWYAHLHKGKTYGRMYRLLTNGIKKSYKYSYNHWVFENQELFIKMIEMFMPIPNFPKDWKEQIYNKDLNKNYE